MRADCCCITMTYIISRPVKPFCAGRGIQQSPKSNRHYTAQRLRIHAAQGEKESWDIRRFASTVLFFNPPPSLQSIAKSVSRAFGAQKAMVDGTAATRQWVVVTGATGGVGSRVVRKLLASGQNVRAIVRDPGKARKLLGNLPGKDGAQLDIVTGDITQPSTLQSHWFADASGLISATAATVAPKEGDTADRQKYKQGVKFYDPEVVGSSPEAVEWRGIQNLINAAEPSLSQGGSIPLFDPALPAANVEWGPLDDVVMGGTSQSRLTRQPDSTHAVFSGRVSAANNGGFASVRTRNFAPALNLEGNNALRLRVKGDGLRYKLSVRCDSNWDGVGYTQSFDTKDGEWQDVDLPFREFIPVFRAKTKADADPFNPASVVSIQLMLSKFEYDGKLNPSFRLGEFALPIASISAVNSAASPHAGPAKLVHVSSAGVTRPQRPGIDLEKEPPAVRMNDELGGLLTYKLAGEDAIRNSKIPHAIVRPVALTEEPAGEPLEIAQGDNIKGKISREEIASLCIALLEEPSAVYTTFEIRSTVPFSQPFIADSQATQQVRDWSTLLKAAKLDPKITGKLEDKKLVVA